MKWNLVLLLCIAVTAGTVARAAAPQALSPELQKLDISAGHWVYHGESMSTPPGKAGKWTWNEDCAWSENRTFMVCSFTNDWSGRIIKSLVVDTWNEKDKSYRHYELFVNGDPPFISRMTVNGNTRIEYAESVNHGKTFQTRITYVFDSPSRVRVKIETSRSGAGWVTVDQGEGVKQP